MEKLCGFLRAGCLDFFGILESREINIHPVIRKNRRRNSTSVKLMKDFHARIKEEEFHQGIFHCDTLF